MITLDGNQYGTAAELAQALGPDVTPAMIRHWADPQREPKPLPRAHLPGRGRGTVVYPLDIAQEMEQRKRRSRLGRPRLTSDRA